MKKILIVDGGPRRNMNTAALCDAFAEGARAVSPEIAVERVRLYDLPPFKGCMSCMACKLKDRASLVCKFKDGLLPVLEAAAAADGLALASPIYMGCRTAMAQAFLERLVFPWLSYHDFSCTVPKKMPVAVLYTMNAPEQFLPMLDKQLGMGEQMLGNLGPVERVLAFNTYQVKDYSRYEFAPATAETKQAYRDAHWEADLAAARDAGRRMAEKALA
jgi:multimeric flavodoxin WrbA